MAKHRQKCCTVRKALKDAINCNPKWLNRFFSITTELGRQFAAIQSHQWQYISFLNLGNEITPLLSTYFAEFRKYYNLKLHTAKRARNLLRNVLFYELLLLFNRLSIANIKNVSESTLQQITYEIGRFGLLFNVSFCPDVICIFHSATCTYP